MESNREPVTESHGELIVFKEDGAWLAAWSRYDLLAQGPTKEEAVNRLFRSIGRLIVYNVEAGLQALDAATFPPMMPGILDKYRKLAAQTRLELAQSN